MTLDLSRILTEKFVEIVILGRLVSPALASDIIRQTDLIFKTSRFYPVSDYGHAVRTMLNFPAKRDPVTGSDQTGPELDAAVSDWRDRWGAIELEWLANALVLRGSGWCYPDGSICFAGELEDYPMATEILSDCQRIASAFPNLVLDVAVWGDGTSMLGFPMFDAPPSPWPAELLTRVAVPAVGFMIHDDIVETVPGSDPRLFQTFGLGHAQAVETAIGEFRRCKDQTLRQTAFGDRRFDPGVPDEMIRGWVTQARSLGMLAGPEPGHDEDFPR